MLGTGGFSNPEAILKNLDIKKGMRIADFGSGSGYFTILLAQMVGQDGLVTAVDVLDTALATIKSKAQLKGLFNINYTRGNLEVIGGSALADSSQDLVLLANILFQSQKKDAIVREAQRVLKVNGELAVVDWVPSSVFGPSQEGWKISKQEARVLIEGLGFSWIKDIPASTNHWGLLFKKS